MFSKLNATVRENVGIGDVRSGFSDRAVREAASRAGAGRLVNALPRGLDTPLECMGLSMPSFGEGASSDARDGRQGLSGGEVNFYFLHALTMVKSHVLYLCF